MMRTTSLVFFAASMAIIFAFFYQVNTVEGRGRSSGRGGWGGGSSRGGGWGGQSSRGGGWGGGSSRGGGWGGRSSSRGISKGSSIGGGYYKKKGYLSCV